MTADLRQIEDLFKRTHDDLFARADQARRDCCGDAVHVRGVIEFSNVCSRNCAYCGLRRGNRLLRRYTMTRDEIVAAASAASRAGVRTIVLQSGENDDAPAEHLAEVIREIKRAQDVAVTVSAGVKPTETYRLWREAGADRYLLKHETAAEFLHGRFCTKSALRRRLSALKRLKELGYQIGSGGIVGLPGQTVRDLSEDIRLLAELDVDMAAFGPFVPHGQTPLAGEPAGSLELSLRVIAVARIALGPVHIPATSALDAVAPDGRERALRAGADVIMANITPPSRRKLYDIYPHRALNSIERVKAICARAGRPIALDHGHSLKR